MTDDKAVELIASEILRLENSIEHLLRSNVEMVEEMKTDSDPIYPTSIAENEVLVQKQRRRIEELKRRLK